jgi:3'(2'), 5'-bisphosphate nucleotidase
VAAPRFEPNATRDGVPTQLDDVQVAVELAAAAGRTVMRLREEADRAGDEAGPALGRRADAAGQATLAEGLARLRPDDRVLSEEARDDPGRLDADRVWIVDPLDGTREFGERDTDGRWRDDFAVHVALWQRGAGLIAAAVAIPARGIVHRSNATWAASAGREDLQRPLRVAVSRTRPPAVLTALAESGLVHCVRLGSAGFKVVAVLEGVVDAYVHTSGLHEWDAAAPVAVARGAGLVATRIDGSEQRYNQPVPWVPDLLVCNPRVAGELGRLLGGPT